MKKKILSTISIAVPINVLAQVNMKNGNYVHQAEDDLDVKTGTVRLQKSYSSRSLYKGPMGFGWCSMLEEKLNMDETKIRTEKCGEITPANGVVFKDGRYIRFEEGKPVAEFDVQGTLQRIHTDRGHTLTLIRDSQGRLSQLKTAKNEIIDIIWDKSFRYIIVLKTLRNEIRFEYANGDLIAWKSNRKTESYRYDQAHNMTSIENGSGGKKVSYVEKADVVKKVLHKNGCEETFEYQSKNEFTDETTLTRSCPGEGKFKGRQEYTYRKENDGSETLVIVKTIVGSRVNEMKLDSQAGRPLTITRGGKSAKLKYATTGELNELEVTPIRRGEQ